MSVGGWGGPEAGSAPSSDTQGCREVPRQSNLTGAALQLSDGAEGASAGVMLAVSDTQVRQHTSWGKGTTA